MVLFGSYSKGLNKEGSDIDIVVISDDFKGKNYLERIEILTDAVYAVFQPIEAVAMTTEEWERGDSVIAGFARDGQVISV